MHLLFRDFGSELAPMPSFLPAELPVGKSDTSTLRWAVRSNGKGGFLFVNNHQRAAKLPAHDEVQFEITTPEGKIQYPSGPVTIPSGARFIWPFHLDLGGGLQLETATAQLICRIEQPKVRTYFFAETPGVAATFKLSNGLSKTVEPGRGIAIELESKDRDICIVVLSEEDSLALWKGNLAGTERVVLSAADVIFDNGSLELRAEDLAKLSALVYPPLKEDHRCDGVFGALPDQKLPEKEVSTELLQLQTEKFRDAGPSREVTLGKQKVASAPVDEDFARAAAWKVQLPDDFKASNTAALLRIRYQGDVARVKIGDKLVIDDFYNGRPLEVGMHYFAEELSEKDSLTIEILPLSPDAPIFIPKKPKEAKLTSLEAVELIPYHERQFVQFRAR